MTRIGGIIFARMNSKRLPGKAMVDISGKTLLERVIERTKKIKNIEHFCIATSINKEDDEIASFAIRNQISLYRGSLNNVISRAAEAAVRFKYDSFLRICGDRPFFDIDIYDEMLRIHKLEKHELTTNIFPRTVPPGLTGEIIDLKSLRRVLNLTTDKLDLLPNASIIPIGKQKIKEKKETINVKDKPPQAPVSTHSKPNSPPDIR